MPKQKTVQKTKKVEKKEKTKKSLTRKERIAKLYALFSRHIGQLNGITARQVFEALYGDTINYTQLELFFIWSLIRQDMNYLRRKTYCFIGSKKTDVDWIYYVVKTKKDADPYLSKMDETIERCKYMKSRCKKAVDQRFYLRL